MTSTLPTNAVWLITGCSSGIGAALAHHVSSSGGRVAATARKTSALSHLPDSPNVRKLQLDVTSTESITNAIAATLKHFGRIDVVVNNAGYGLFGDMEATTDEQARKQFETNFWGAVQMTQKTLPVFRDENRKNGAKMGGVVVQVSSVGGWVGFPGGAFYHATKFALEGFTEAVAKEMHPDWNIRFLILEPGGVKTEYAGSSMVHTARHPAYTEPGCPINQLLAYLSDPNLMGNFADPKAIAKVTFDTVVKGNMPQRLPMGSDSWGMIKADVQQMDKEMDSWKAVSESCSGSSGGDQLSSIDFLKK